MQSLKLSIFILFLLEALLPMASMAQPLCSQALASNAAAPGLSYKADINIQNSEALIKKLELMVADSFEVTGHKNLQDFIAYSKNFSPFLSKVTQLIETDAVVGIHIPSSLRLLIFSNGILNQRVTGTSGAILDPVSPTKKTSPRDRAESKLTGIPEEDYVGLDADFKPKYGLMLLRGSDEILTNYNAKEYGSDIWILKNSVAESRVTWTPADSLAPSWYKFTGANFDNVFIPWSYRALAAPYVNSAKTGFVPGTVPSSFKFLGRDRWEFGKHYFETQIFGPITINDIQAFHFTETPPDRKFYDLLLSKGIEVYDERTWPAKKYEGSESF